MRLRDYGRKPAHVDLALNFDPRLLYLNLCILHGLA